MWRMPGRSKFWLSLRALPVRSWIAQQLMKLAAPSVCPEEILVCVDSDVTLMRPFDHARLLVKGKLGLLDVDYADGMVPRWTKVSEKLLGLRPGTVPLRGHVGSLIALSRQCILDLQAHVEATSGVDWQIAIARNRTFSEYNLYGAYIREVIGYARSPHAPSSVPLVKQPWLHSFASDDDIRAFLSDLEPENIAVMVHSKYNVSEQRLRTHFEAAWQRHQTGLG